MQEVSSVGQLIHFVAFVIWWQWDKEMGNFEKKRRELSRLGSEWAYMYIVQ